MALYLLLHNILFPLSYSALFFIQVLDQWYRPANRIYATC